MVKMQIKYQGQKNCLMIHEPSQSKVETDAPKDNYGKGERFSPTDLLSSSLVSCMLTTIAILSEPQGLDFTGCFGSVVKEMTGAPRRVKSLEVELHLPKKLTAEQKTLVENQANGCPVKASLNPDVIINTTFIYDVE